MGEFALIRRIAEVLEGCASQQLRIGIGDDAAVWQGSSTTVATTDTVVEGVHFLPSATGRDVGFKCMAANISDAAAMAAEPRFALVTLMLPADTRVEWVTELYAGMRECAAAFEVQICGGDIVRSRDRAVTIALYAEPCASLGGETVVLRRDAARKGDVLAVTGTLGGSRGGLELLIGTALDGIGETEQQALLDCHYRPRPKVAEALALAELGVRCAMDLSDGLSGDLPKLCEASGLGAELWSEEIPVHPAVPKGLALEYALTGGEDYELLVSLPPHLVETAKRRLWEMGTTLTVIGRMSEASDGVRLQIDSSFHPVRSAGWDHFAH